MMIDLAAELLAEIVRRVLRDVIRRAGVDVRIDVRERQVLDHVRADRADPVRRNPVVGKRLPRAADGIRRQRVINNDRPSRGVGERREITRSFRRGRHVVVRVLREAVAIAFNRKPEEHPILEDRSADRSAGIAPELIGIRLTLVLQKEVFSDERSRPRQKE